MYGGPGCKPELYAWLNHRWFGSKFLFSDQVSCSACVRAVKGATPVPIPFDDDGRIFQWDKGKKLSLLTKRKRGSSNRDPIPLVESCERLMLSESFEHVIVLWLVDVR